MNLVLRLAQQFDVSEYTIFEWSANAHANKKFINVVSDYTVWRRVGIIPLYVFSYNRVIRCTT